MPDGPSDQSETRVVTPLPRPGLPDRIGNYRIVGILGQGGMGVVYDALQTEPIRRQVALKVIKLGMDTAQVVARFDAERQALAVMDHPNIAKVLDAGASDTGRPYFVMEQVHGLPITEYCDRHTLGTGERLSLFASVCRGVQHAHQKGVIHRDLKPTNVLVVDDARGGIPKIIDFGIAKAISWQLTEETLVTEIGQAIGTPAYMSPEQADASERDIDTRTDVYSLGVLLYELLVGCLPSDVDEISVKTFLARLASHTTDPPTPSQRLSQLGEDGIAIARTRRTDPKTLQRELHGDLDWIVMKAMEPDRSRRYGTAEEVAVEVERYRHHEPVLARPPSVRYMFAKFVRRNRLAVAAASTVALSLMFGAAAAGIGMMRAQRAEAIAAQEADAALQVSTFLEDLFGGSEPQVARGSTITAREILDRGAERIENELRDQPLLKARLQVTIGRVYSNLGLFERARGQLEQALDIRRSVVGEDHREVVEALFELGRLAHRQGRFADAESILAAATSIADESLGEDDPLLPDSYEWLGRALHEQQAELEATPIYDRVLAMREAATGTETRAYAWTLYLTALLEGRYQETESALQRSRSILERLGGEDDPDVAAVLEALSSLYCGLGRFDEAEDAARHAIAIRERVWGPEHRLLARAIMALGRINEEQGRYAEAESLYLRGLEIDEKHLGPEHPDYVDDLTTLGWLYHAMGRSAAAESLITQTVSIYEASLGPDHFRVALALGDLAALAKAQGKQDEAEQHFRRAHAIRESAFGPDDPDVATSASHLGNHLRDVGRYAEADSFYLQALRIWEKSLGPDDPEVAWLLTQRALSFQMQGKFEAAEDLFLRALAINEEGIAGDQIEVAWQVECLGRLYVTRAQYANGASTYERALALREEALGPTHEDVLRTLAILYSLYTLQNNVAETRSVGTRLDSIIDVTMSSYEAASANDATVSGQSWNALCRLGSLSERARRVFDACEAAVALEPDNPDFRDSRGVARAELGDYAGAIEDFETYLASNPPVPHRDHRLQWMPALRSGQNPFTPEWRLTLLISSI